MTGKQYDTIIVGGGIAGLTAAAYLTRAGQKVLLFEKNRECGGLVNSFVRDGFHFDAGVRALEDAGIILPMLQELGIQLEFVKSPVSVGIEKEILHIKDTGSLNDYREMLTRLYPESEEEIREILRIIRKIMKHMDVLYGIENPVFKDLKRDRSYLFRTLLPWLPRFLFTVGKINRMNMPVETYLEQIIQNRPLRDIISQHFFRNTPTFFALSYFSLYLDYLYPRGGVGKLAEAVKMKILEMGGEIRTETLVTEVLADQHQAVTEGKESYSYRNLIWAADLKTFYRVTQADGLQPKIRKKFGETRARMEAHRGGDSVFTLFLGVDEPLETFGEIAHGHFFYTPSREGLGNIHREELDQLLRHREGTSKETILAWLERFIRLNTFEISIPGLKDPDLVPPGKTGLIISLLAEYDLFDHARAGGWYDELIQAFEDQMLRVISDTIYPMLRGRILSRFSFSPLSIANRILSSEGAITGWSFQDQVPVVHKIQLSDRSVFTPIPGIYQAGQWAYSPAGVPMSILTGKLASEKVLKKR